MKKLSFLLGSIFLGLSTLHIFAGSQWLWAAAEMLAAGALLHFAQEPGSPGCRLAHPR